MANMRDPRKKRTREHVIADLSLVHIQYYIVNCGFTFEETNKDYGYDLIVNTFDREGFVGPGSILIQLKASETLEAHGDGVSYVYDLDVRDYNLWVTELNPVFLILFEARSRRAYWVYFQRYVKGTGAPRPRAGATTVRIKIPMANKVRTDFFRHARRLNKRVLQKLSGVDLHG